MRIAGLLKFFLTFSIILLVLGFLGRMHWIFELLSNLRWNLAFGIFIITLVLALMLKEHLKFYGVIIVLALFIVAEGIISNIIYPSPEIHKDALKIASINLLSSNTNADELFELIHHEDPDIIAFQEYNNFWHDQLSNLNAYPYREYKIQEGNFGIATYSKINPMSDTIHFFSDQHFPSVISQFKTEGKYFELINTHVDPPGGNKSGTIREKHFDSMTKYINQANSKNLLVVGDFNTTKYSPLFKDFKINSNLILVPSGQMNDKTWPTILGIFGIRIDHFFYKGNLQVQRGKRCQGFGSDHASFIYRID